MGGKHLLPLLCIALLVSDIPLWANPPATDLRDGNKGSPNELFAGSPEPGIHNGDSSPFAPSQWSAPSSQNTLTIDSPNGFVFGNLSLFSTLLKGNVLPFQIEVLLEGCSEGPSCLVEGGLMLRF